MGQSDIACNGTIKETAKGPGWVLVTGGAKRIGAAICKALHSDGYNLIIHCNHSVTEANTLAALLNESRSGSAEVIQAQLGSGAAVDKVFSDVSQILRNTAGMLVALINNASVFTPETDRLDFTEVSNVMAVNAISPYLLAKRLYPFLAISSGAVVNLCDIHGQRPLKRHGVYSISKAALEMATLALAQELAPHVRVNGVAPGAILWPQTPNTDTDAVCQQIPLGRVGEVMDIANTVSFLLKAGYISGQIIAVDGGRSATGYQGAAT